jgi:hypothetical protein
MEMWEMLIKCWLENLKGGDHMKIRPRRRWEDNIKTDFGEIGCGGVDRIHLAQNSDRWQPLMNAVMNLWVPQMTGNFLTI